MLNRDKCAFLPKSTLNGFPSFSFLIPKGPSEQSFLIKDTHRETVTRQRHLLALQ